MIAEVPGMGLTDVLDGHGHSGGIFTGPDRDRGFAIADRKDPADFDSGDLGIRRVEFHSFREVIEDAAGFRSLDHELLGRIATGEGDVGWENGNAGMGRRSGEAKYNQAGETRHGGWASCRVGRVFESHHSNKVRE